MNIPAQLSVKVVAIRLEVDDIASFVLAPLASQELPGFGPGSHIEVHLNDKLTRAYSLSNGMGDTGRYRLTVQKDPASRGGSTFMHEQVRIGQVLTIGAPRNNFDLDEHAAMSVFVAGGIGITPFLPMMARLNALGKPWRLHYCARSRSRAALVDEVRALAEQGHGELTLNFDDEPGATMLDLTALVAALAKDAHIYCCGPSGMLRAYQAATAVLPSERVHYEFFANEATVAAEGGFTVVLARSGGEVRVAPGQTILQAVRAAGASVQSSCEEGVCGACETRVICGVPDHRDAILGKRERESNKTMMICCSGCKSDRLELDI